MIPPKTRPTFIFVWASALYLTLAACTIPSNPGILINSSDSITTSADVTLTLSITNGEKMYVTNTENCEAGGIWEPFSDTKTWTLGQTNTTATVYVKYMDKKLVQSACVHDSIVHDDTAPTTPSNISDGIRNPSLTDSPSVTWTASTDSGTGLNRYQMAIGSTSGGTNVLDWTNIGTVTTHSVSSLTLTSGSTYYASLRAIDNAGNTSASATGDGWMAVGWAQEAYVKASNNNASDRHYIVAIDGDTMVVGAPNEDSNQTTISNGAAAASSNNANADSGAVYVYKRTGTTWAQEAYIKASNNNAGDNFGISVAISGDTIAVGATAEDSNQTTITNGAAAASANNANADSGAVYVYKRTGTTWAQEAYIKASNDNAGDFFGASVAINSNTLVVGATREDSNQTTISNGAAAASANNANVDSGAVYVYKRTGTTWAQEAYIKAANNGAGDAFGTAVTIVTDTIAVGVPEEDSNQTTITNGTTASADNSALASGAVYVYKRTGVNWAQEAYVKPPNTGASDKFGSSVSVHADTLAVGAPQESSNETTITNGTSASSDNSASQSGAAYVFKRTGTSWAQEAYLKAANTDAGDLFGTSVAIEGDLVVVGAPNEDSNQTTITNGTSASTNNGNVSAGAAYVYSREGSTWTRESYAKAPNNNAADRYGITVGIDSDTIAIGAIDEASNQTSITNGTTGSSNNGNTGSSAVYVIRY